MGNIGSFNRRQSRLKRRRYLFGDVALDSENVLYFPVVRGAPEAFVRGNVI
jgi:hypothetical protein